MNIDPLLLAVLAGLGLSALIVCVRSRSRGGVVLSAVALGAVVVAFVVGDVLPSPSLLVALLLIAVSLVTGIVAIVLGLRRSPAQASRGDVEYLAEARAARAEAEHQARVEQIRQWEAAYRDAHDGAAPPRGFSPPMIVQAPATPGTNTFAIAAFVFGILGGVLGLVFGLIGLSQIGRTGQGGRGLAIAGIVLAIFWLFFYLPTIRLLLLR